MAYRRIWFAGAALVLLPATALAQQTSTESGPAPAAQAAPAKPAPPKAQPAARPAPPAKGAPPVKTVDEVTVNGAVPDVQVSIDKKSYNLAKDLQATTGSIADALRNLPAVEVDPQGNISLRGDQNVTILVDGKPSPAFDGKDRADALQQLPADQIERVEVITNPSAALNPEGTGGVINLITKTSRGGGLTGSTYATAGSAGLKRAGINLGYNTKTLAVTAAVSSNYQHNKNHVTDERDGLDPISDQFLKNFDKSQGRNLARGPNARLSLTWTPQDRDQFTFATSYGFFLIQGHPDDLYTDDGPSGTPVSEFEHSGHRRYIETTESVSTGWRHTFAEGHDLSVDAVYNVDLERDHTLFSTLPIIPQTPVPLELIRDDYSQHHAELRVAYAQKLWGGALKAGYELRHEDNDANYADAQGPGPESLVPVPALANHFVFEQLVNAVYATWQRGFGKLDAQFGLRAEDVTFELAQLTSGQRPSQHYERAYPSLHLGYKLDDDRRLTASYSVRVQRPPTVFLNPLIYFEGPQDAQVGNPNLKVKEVEIYELGYDQKVGQQDLQANVYFRNARHDFAQVLVDLGGGRFESSFGNFGTAEAAGVDFTASGKLTATLSYNLTLSPYWYKVDAGNLATSIGAITLWGSSERGTLNWQATPDDALQLNVQANGRRVQAQGYFEPFVVLNAGWRHKINDRLSATVTAQDLGDSTRFRRDLSTSALVEHLAVHPVSRAVIFRLDYRFGGGAAKAKTPDFDYGNGGGGPGPGGPGGPG
ncbi:TonB-dependent receptor [Phenylobacterium sp.]|jgi:outer membrane receptor protein involved in Fe transport|uniref:TonB-dependent receptor n=1 Tax=Phenylobacterium sp. TaxID=1871053 RepID=UPI002F3F814E